MKSLQVGDRVIVGAISEEAFFTAEGLYISEKMKRYEGKIATISSRYPTGNGKYRYYIEDGDGWIWDSTLIRPFNNNHTKGGKLI